MKRKLITLCSFMLALAGVHLNAVPLGTAFTYQGRLADGANPANGRYDLQCAVYDAAVLGNRIGNIVTNTAVAVNNGLFSVNLDFGANIFTGNACWLAMGVRSNGVAANFTPLDPRQPMTAAPHALHALTAGTVTEGSVMASQFKTTGAPAAGQILTYNGSSLVWQTPGGPNLWSVNGNNAYYNGGNVGIGTSAPSGKLTVATTTDDAAPSFITAFDGRHAVIGTASEGLGLSYSTSTGAGYITALAPSVAWKDLVLQARSLSFNISGETAALSVLNNGNVNVNGPLTAASHVYISGNVDIGNAAPTPGLLNEFLVSGTFNFTTLHTQTRLVVKQNGDVGIGTATPLSKLDVRGVTRTCALQITGGCDLAEPFPMSSANIPKGAVVVIDPKNPGQLKTSEVAYDKHVAGIISGANGINTGIALKQEGALDQGENVALTGRVFVQADAANGAIEPGDLLTTSPTPGHAMKVTDFTRAHGAILGKAMSVLHEGKGMVLVLVTLQ